MDKNFSDLTLAALETAKKAGELLRKGFDTSFHIDSKEGRYNLVTEYDTKAESLIIDSIQKTFPTHAFLSEECGAKGSGDITWVIDPIDGTVNFARAIPAFSISIAATQNNQILSGVVYAPMTNELFVAEKGKGAYLNDKRLSVSKTTSLSEVLIATGFPYNLEENPRGAIDIFTKFARLGTPLRRIGSAAIDLAYLAAGRFDGFWEVSLKPWDFAAALLLVEEAGGILTDFQGKPYTKLTEGPVLASNRHLHQELLTQIQNI